MSCSLTYCYITRILPKRCSVPFVTIGVNPGTLEGSRSPRFCIGGSPTEPHPSLHHVSGMTCHLNPTHFLYLHYYHCQSQTIIFIRLLYPSIPGLPLKTKMLSLQKLLL